MDNSTVANSREKLRNAFAGTPNLTFIRLWGNIGDNLIYAGTRQLLRDVDYQEVSIQEVKNMEGHTALLSGGGGWCSAFNVVPEYLDVLESRFERVIVLPSSFDPAVKRVRDALSRTKALVFAREMRSYELIRNLCEADLACDCAFFFDFGPYRQTGAGTLDAFRTDRESKGFPLPVQNNDISLTCDSLDEWLWRIARSNTIRTDRAHVTIAATLLGKSVEYLPSNYHKVQAIVEYTLEGYPITRIPEPENSSSLSVVSQLSQADGAAGNDECLPQDRSEWLRWIEDLTQQVASAVGAGEKYIFLDGAQIGWLPLGEREVVPFPEKDGHFSGTPENSKDAIGELERLRSLGARKLVIAWTAFWWIDYYHDFALHLSTNYKQIVSNAKLTIYDLEHKLTAP